mgnify:CR=1 FL=1
MEGCVCSECDKKVLTFESNLLRGLEVLSEASLVALQTSTAKPQMCLWMVKWKENSLTLANNVLVVSQKTNLLISRIIIIILT